jgi:hypothetical protein
VKLAASLRDAKTRLPPYPRIALRFILGYFRSFPPGRGRSFLVPCTDVPFPNNELKHVWQQESFLRLPANGLLDSSKRQTHVVDFFAKGNS